MTTARRPVLGRGLRVVLVNDPAGGPGPSGVDVQQLALAEGIAPAAGLLALAALLDEDAVQDRASVLLASGVRLPEPLLLDFLDTAGDPTALLVAPDGPGAAVRASGGRVTSAASSWHTVAASSGVSTGVLRVASRDAPAAASAARAMAEACGEARPGDPLDLLVVALVRSGVHVRAEPVGPWPWGRSSDPATLARLEKSFTDLDVERLRRQQALRAGDGFYSTFVLRRLSGHLTHLTARTRLTPNAVTLVSLAVGLLAAGCFATGDRTMVVTGAVLMQISLVVDCVDGELARLTRRFSTLGGWLDGATDRIKEYACYAGLAAGASEAAPGVWVLAGAMLTLQTFRHMLDYDFTQALQDQEAGSAVRALDLASDALGAGAGVGARAVAVSARSSTSSAIRWAKHVAHLPIGERWLLLSVAAGLLSPFLALVVLLGAAALALVYTTAGRCARSLSWSPETAPGGVTRYAGRLDAGPLSQAAVFSRLPPAALTFAMAGPVAGVVAFWRGDGVLTGVVVVALLLVALLALAATAGRLLGTRFAWATLGLLRLMELGTVLAVVRVADAGLMPLAYGLAFVLAYHHYDGLYRAQSGADVDSWLPLWGLGYDGRVLLVIVSALVSAGALTSTLEALTLWCAVLLGAVPTVSWLRRLSRESVVVRG